MRSRELYHVWRKCFILAISGAMRRAGKAIPMTKLAQDGLDAYAGSGRAGLAEGLGYKAIRRRLEEEHRHIISS